MAIIREKYSVADMVNNKKKKNDKCWCIRISEKGDDKAF